jgi:hypothetical protein
MSLVAHVVKTFVLPFAVPVLKMVVLKFGEYSTYSLQNQNHESQIRFAMNPVPHLERKEAHAPTLMGIASQTGR